MLKVINNRCNLHNSYLFNYAHFICDCVFPEFIDGVGNRPEKTILRKKKVRQSLGKFSKMYEVIFNKKNVELEENKFINSNCPRLVISKKENIEKENFFKFQKYIWDKFLNLNDNFIFPEILLINRGVFKLEFNSENKIINITSGNHRREIKKINKLHEILTKKYKNNYKMIQLQNHSFKQQVNYFYNAKIIILAHGAAMSNMFFCKKNTKIIEVTDGNKWLFFDKISNILKLNHLKCENKIENILNKIN